MNGDSPRGYQESMESINAVAKQVVASPEVQAMIREHAVYKEYWEAQEAWNKAQDPMSPNQDYLEAADRYRASTMAVKKLRGEVE